ncbi:putative E3 ubiquitin-protein ligase makorin-1-like isoform 2 [Scophthalmus maximus]|uniref:RING-type E3 ubiquitin transferase n=1 Tax=Scophthalmus maximus TaxID=52904 RepID=A0A2U9BZ58_SCOMX|nr:makorin, ring finger protein, 4 isoform X3 [Scophthalmus maximus]AWP09615.1 putative E3 ubiquitin-protein ligase makorin-1-like isoform 2 [Scophthalmus maximus]
MEGAWRQSQNTGRMDSGRGGGICRHFLSGSCRFGPRCHYRHEWPVIQSAQICRHFQKGVCWYGERCRFLHVLQSDVDAAVAGRRGSVPAVSSTSRVARAQPDRRGSEPTLMQAQMLSRHDCSRSGRLAHISNSNIGRLAVNITVEESQDTESLTASLESVQSSNAAEAGASDRRNEQQTSSTETTEEGAAAAASGTQGEVEALLQSKNVTCGICMDKVYEKTDLREQVFGILPNCSHAFCLQCIMTWRKMKDFEPDVVKSCPQCRVRSAFYVPNKYWVEGQAKESVIVAFKEKCRRKSCIYYARYGCCPFKTECLYRHDKSTRRRSFTYPTEDEDDYDGLDLLNFFIAMTLLSGDDDDDVDDYDFTFSDLTEEYGF